MKGEGRLLAMDAAQARLDRSAERLKRAGVNERHHGFVERRAARDLAAEDLQDAFDRVLVDAPCSGSGAWRRHPDARWRLTPADLERCKAAQRDLRSEEHTSELQTIMRIQYAVFCLKKQT